MKSTPEHLELLDYIRGIAIVGVLFCHLFTVAFGLDAIPWEGWVRDFSVPDSTICLSPLDFGRFGVALFFVVSGFCIHLAFQRQGKSWRPFFIRRFFRIYPPYLAALVLSLLMFCVNSGPLDSLVLWPQIFTQMWRQIWTHLCLVHNADPLTLLGINGPLWSLAVEAQLYLLYPILLFYVGKTGWQRSLAYLAACEFAIRALDGVTQAAGIEGSPFGRVVWTLAQSPFGYWFSWAIGAFIADAFLKSEPLPFQRISPGWWLCLAVGCWFFKPLVPFQFPLFAMATAAVTSKFLSQTGLEANRPGRVLRSLKNLGLWSYSLYLLHMPLIQGYSLLVNWALPEESLNPPIYFLIMVTTLAAVVPFSILFYRTVEVPSIALGKRILGRGYQAALKPSLVTLAALLVCTGLNLVISAKFSIRNALESNNRAWSLATSPEPTKRNGALAVELAEYACRQTLFRRTIMVGTLAAAYAEAGRFEDAISTAQKACALASSSGEQQLLQKNKELLSIYLKHQPYRESARH